MFGNGEWHPDGRVVVGRYIQTRQRWLRAKIVKSGHDRHYKEALAMYKRGTTQATRYKEFENQEIENKY